jgi:nucleotide-binding universal stress UspA family protein
MFRRLLICTDLTDGLNRFARFVPSLALSGIQKITFLHCVPVWNEGDIPRIDEEKLALAKATLAPALVNVPANVEVQLEFPSGRPLDLILETIQKVQPDLVITGMPSRSLLDEKLFGSDTLGLVKRLTIPLMVFRPQLISAFTSEELELRCRHLFRHLLIPYDGSPASEHLLRAIRHQAEHRPANSLQACSLCWVIDESSSGAKDQIRQAETTLKELAADLASLQLQTFPLVRQGNPVLETQAAAGEQDISAIAVSSNHAGQFWELSVPSFTGEILRRSWHPVLFFPPSDR